MKRYRWLILTVLPILFFITANLARQARGAFWQGQYDPSYFYLLNSLSLLVSETPSLVQHPGTPMQIFGAIVIAARYVSGTFFGVNPEGVVYSVLEDPETFISAINTSVVLLIAIATFTASLVAFHFSKNLILSLILQISLFLPRTGFIISTAVQAELMLLFVIQLLIILLLIYLYQDQIENKRLFAVLLGAIFGFGMAVKITFAPLIIFFLLIPKFQLKVIAGITALLSFLIGTLPIISRYEELFSWLTNIGLRSGQYGTGDKTFIDLSRVPTVFSQFFNEHGTNGDTFFFVLTGSAVLVHILAVCFWYYRHRHDFFKVNSKHPLLTKPFQLFNCLVFVFIIQIALALKGEGLHYLIPTMALCGLLVFMQLLIAENALSSFSTDNLLNKLRSKYLPIVVLTLLLAIGLNHSYKFIEGGLKSQFYIRAETRIVGQLIANYYSHCRKVMLIGSFSRQYAIKAGSSGIETVVSPYLKERYPDYLFQELGTSNNIVDADGNTVNLADLPQQCVLLQTASWVPPTYDLPMKPIFEGAYQTIYLLEPS